MREADIFPGCSPPSEEIEQVIAAILRSKSVVVICGAGISVAAGITPFRGPTGIYNTKVGGYKAEELFHIQALQNRESRREFCQLMADMASAAAVAKPTSFHELLVALHNHRKLLRVYTQNVDGLELKSGLCNSRAYGIHKHDAVCVPLHGHLHQMRCQSCGGAFAMDAYVDVLAAGKLPSCVDCETDRTTRAQLNLRDRKTISTLRPDVILYGEQHPRAEEIAEIQKKDVRAADLLLVVGTSMKVDGIQTMIRTFTQALSIKHGKNKAPFISSIYINIELTSRQKWSEMFDFWVRGDCESFADIMHTHLEKTVINCEKDPMRTSSSMTEEKEDEAVTILKARMAVTDRRLDLRPLWRYY